jgi:hypothetical protein
LPDLSQGFSPPEAKMERSGNPVKGSNVSENCYKCSISISPTARGAYRIIAVLTKVEPDEQG